MPSIRVFLLDHDAAFLVSAASFLATLPDVEVIGQANSVADATEKVAATRPDVVFATLEMPGTSGLVAAIQFKALSRPPRVVILSDHEETPYRSLAEAIQTDGFLLKHEFRERVGPLLTGLPRSEPDAPNPTAARFGLPGPTADNDLLLASVGKESLYDLVVDHLRAQETLQQLTCLATLGASVGLALTSDSTAADLPRCRCSTLIGGSRTAFEETIEDALHLSLVAVVRNLDAAFARVWTLDATGETLELRASAGHHTPPDEVYQRIPVGQHKVGKIAKEQRPYLTNDLQHDPLASDPEWARREGIVAFAGYPLLVDGKLIGVMGMFAKQPLSDYALQGLGHVADMVALGIERKRTQEALTRSEERLRAFIDGAQDILFDLDSEGKFLALNPAFEAITGWPASSWLGLPFGPLLHPEDEKRGEELFARVMAGERLPRFEIRLNGREGKVVTVEVTTAPRIEGGVVVGVFGISRDISERKQLEEQYRQAQKLEALGQLAAGVAHDFNNLLTVILGFSEIVLATLHPSDPLRMPISQIQSEGERAALLTRQLLAFSRKQVMQSAVLDVNALLTGLETLFGRLIGEDVELVLDRAADLWLVKGDVGQIEQVVMNLVVNARDAMPKGGKLFIETANVTLDQRFVAIHPEAHLGDHVRLSVRDTGCGMDAATRARVFEPFFTTKGPERGTGLGLATVFGIVKQSGGHIEVLSEPGLGTTFEIYLPRARNGEMATKPRMEHGSGPRGTETVLLAEDEEVVRSLIEKILQQHGYRVLEARDGAEALLICQGYEEKIDLLVTDVVMPKLSGHELEQKVRAQRPGIKVLYLSGYPDDAIGRHGVLEADTHFLQKPFSPNALARKVREVLDGAK